MASHWIKMANYWMIVLNCCCLITKKNQSTILSDTWGMSWASQKRAQLRAHIVVERQTALPYLHQPGNQAIRITRISIICPSYIETQPKIKHHISHRELVRSGSCQRRLHQQQLLPWEVDWTACDVKSSSSGARQWALQRGFQSCFQPLSARR